ncbi:MAG: SH3 domain-containing protein [Methyloceanibacter sp.]|nr:SH3 domain-containing protein [Methyloceanibacter sp.]
MTRVLVAAIALLFCVNLAEAAQDRCKVTDPTGTPLNVREGPNGKVTGTLANGLLVSIIESTDDANGKPWVRVADQKSKKPIGWVFREFVSCF